MSKFRYWYLTHATEITWFVIGVCVMAGLDSLARGNYGNAAINFAVAFLNFVMNRR